MTKAEYDQYLKELQSYIDQTVITVHGDPVMSYTLLGAEIYEEVTQEWPKALFRSNVNGKIMPMDLHYTLELLNKKN